MARSREFDPDTAVEQATELFWAYGYRGVSIDGLVRGTGVSRSSLYGVFEGKHPLFLACLERYRRRIVPGTLRGLQERDASLPEIKAYFDGVVKELLSGDGRRGCLLVNSAVELSRDDPEVAEIVQAHLSMLGRCFARALSNARARGQLPASVDPRAGARLLVAAAVGLIVVGKANPDRRLLRGIVSSALVAVGAQ
jgi:TetR/AcrR family transcriptional repressor of nem operon